MDEEQQRRQPGPSPGVLHRQRWTRRPSLAALPLTGLRFRNRLQGAAPAGEHIKALTTPSDGTGGGGVAAFPSPAAFSSDSQRAVDVERSSQRFAAACAPMQERQSLRSRAARRLDLVPAVARGSRAETLAPTEVHLYLCAPRSTGARGTSPAGQAGRLGGARDGRCGLHGGADQLGNRGRLRERDRVGRIDLDGLRAGALGHVALGVRGDCVVGGGDDRP